MLVSEPDHGPFSGFVLLDFKSLKDGQIYFVLTPEVSDTTEAPFEQFELMKRNHSYALELVPIDSVPAFTFLQVGAFVHDFQDPDTNIVIWKEGQVKVELYESSDIFGMVVRVHLPEDL